MASSCPLPGSSGSSGSSCPTCPEAVAAVQVTVVVSVSLGDNMKIQRKHNGRTQAEAKERLIALADNIRDVTLEWIDELIGQLVQ